MAMSNYVSNPRGGTIGNPGASPYVSPTDRPSGQIPPIMGGGPTINYGGGQGINPGTINAINDSWIQGHNEHYGGQQWNWDEWRPSSDWIAENRPNWTGYDSSGQYYNNGQIGPPPGQQPPPGTQPPGTNPDGTQYVGTTITHEPVFSDLDTRYAQNQAAQQAWTGNTYPDVMHGLTRPGMSHDEGTQSLAMPQMAQAGAASNIAQQSIPIMHGMANAASLAASQGALANQFVGLGNQLESQGQSADNRNQMLMNLVQQLLG